MNIDGLGTETIDQFYQAGLIRDIADLYTLKAIDICRLEGMGEKSAVNIVRGIENSRSVPFERVLFAIGIRFVGETIVEYIINEEVSFICPEAFQDCAYLKKLTVGNFVTAISDYAFKNCKALEEVTLGGNVRIIGVESFFGCEKLATINSRGIFPPHNCPTVFEDATKQNCKVYVPKGQLFNYKRRLEWGEFKNMVEF